ncbi:hypothetical protein ADEAN_000371300 [Angomonas deanei]|uniref:Uncharacterized protein n=1 Tax=Angomonas deanei TaxID=59799 RepID=A0A7G2CDP0_9TRYP|nr:hypothetical protein ADEAN_000371300 [Angomonas deanei]
MFSADIADAYNNLMETAANKKVEPVVVDFSHIQEIDPIPLSIVEMARRKRRAETVSPAAAEEASDPMRFAAELGITEEDVKLAAEGKNDCGVLLKSKDWRAYYGDTEDVLFRKLVKNMVKTEDDMEFIKNEVFLSDEVQDDCKRQHIIQGTKSK